MKTYTRTASLIIAIALLAAALTQSSVSAAPRTPEQIMQQAKQVVVGETHACALMKDGSVWCWGNNEFNQLGGYEVCPYSYDPINYHPPDRCPPAPVPGLPGKAKWLYVEGLTTCAVMEKGGQPWCWGFYTGAANNADPTPIPGLYDVTEMAHGYALTRSGDLWQLGGAYVGDCHIGLFLAPILVMSGVRSFSASAFSYIYGYSSATCAVTKDNAVKCWGNNFYGHLGNDVMDYSCAPVDVFNPVPHKAYLPAVNP